MAGIKLEFAQFGDFDTFDIIRSTTSLASVADNALPPPIVSGLTTMYYFDTSVVVGSTYFYKVRVNRDGLSIVSNQIQCVANTPWTPSQITTRAWYDLSDQSTVTLIDNLISAVADKSGNNFNLSQATTSQRPIYSNQINGKRVATFDGVNDFLGASVALLSVTHSLFIVFKPTVEIVTGSLFGQWASGQTGRYVLSTNQNSSGSIASGRLNPFNSTATTGAGYTGLMADFSISNSLTMIDSISTIGAENWKLYKDGLLTDSATVTSLYTGTNSGIGSVSASLISNPYDGDIGEIIVVNSALDAVTRQKVEGYLAHKWGITSNLSNDHPYKNAPPFLS